MRKHASMFSYPSRGCFCKQPTTRVLLRISRFSRSRVLFVRILRQCWLGNSRYVSVSPILFDLAVHLLVQVAHRRGAYAGARPTSRRARFTAYRTKASSRLSSSKSRWANTPAKTTSSVWKATSTGNDTAFREKNGGLLAQPLVFYALKWIWRSEFWRIASLWKRSV